MRTCPNCGEAITRQSICSCGAAFGTTWPPPVAAEPPKMPPVKARLLTGRVWTDEMLGMGLAWLLISGLIKAAVLVMDAYTAYIFRNPFSLDTPPVDAPWLGVGAVALIVLAGAYACLHHSFPKIGRGFGQNALFFAGGMPVVFLCLTLFR